MEQRHKREDIAQMQQEIDELERMRGPSAEIDNLRKGLTAAIKSLERSEKRIAHGNKLIAIADMLRGR